MLVVLLLDTQNQGLYCFLLIPPCGDYTAAARYSTTSTSSNLFLVKSRDSHLSWQLPAVAAPAQG